MVRFNLPAQELVSSELVDFPHNISRLESNQIVRIKKARTRIESNLHKQVSLDSLFLFCKSSQKLYTED